MTASNANVTKSRPTNLSEINSLPWHSPWRQRGHGLQRVGVADHLVEVVDDLTEFGPVVAVLLPAVQHELVQRAGTVHGWGKPVVLLYGIDDLQGETQISKGRYEALQKRGSIDGEETALDPVVEEVLSNFDK